MKISLLAILSGLTIATHPSHAGDEWENHAALDDLRGLPDCLAGEAIPDIGEPYECIPPLSPKGTTLRLGMSLAHGIATGPIELTHNYSRLGVAARVGLTRNIGVSARYGLGFLGLPGPGPNDGPNIFLQHAVTGSLDYRYFIDEVERQAWTLSVGLGRSIYAGTESATDDNHLRLALAYDGGFYLSDRTVLGASIYAEYQQDLSDDSMGTVGVGLQGNVDLGAHKPRNLHEAKARSIVRPAYAMNFIPWIGFGLEFRLPVSNRIELLAAADSVVAAVGSFYERKYYSLHGGLRFQLTKSRKGHVYIRAQGGHSWITDDSDTLKTALTGIGEIGFAFTSCGGSIEVGVRTLQTFQPGGVAVEAGGLALRIQPGHTAGQLSCGPSITLRPNPYVPAPRLVREAPYEPPIERHPVETNVDAEVGVDAQVEVEIEPITIEVIIGASLLGGALDVRIDPRMLPLAQLRNAARVELEVIAPARQAARVQAELRGILTSRGIRLDSSVVNTSSSSVIKARFTILPM